MCTAMQDHVQQTECTHCKMITFGSRSSVKTIPLMKCTVSFQKPDTQPNMVNLKMLAFTIPCSFLALPVRPGNMMHLPLVISLQGEEEDLKKRLGHTAVHVLKHSSLTVPVQAGQPL